MQTHTPRRFKKGPGDITPKSHKHLPPGMNTRQHCDFQSQSHICSSNLH